MAFGLALAIAPAAGAAAFAPGGQVLSAPQPADAPWRLAQGGAANAAAPLQELIRQADALEAKGDYAQALPLRQQILAINERSLGPEHPDTAISLNNLALLYQKQGRYAEAEALIKRSQAIREKALGPEHPDTATSLNDLVFVYQAQGDASNKTNAQIRELIRQAGALEAKGDYARALPLWLQILAIREKVLGPEHPDTANSLNNLASLYGYQGRYREAEPLYKRALAIREKALGPEHPDTAHSLKNLASLYGYQGRYGEAEPLYKRALAIREKVLGLEHTDTANSLNNLASLYLHQGRYGEAEPLYKRALAIREKALGPEHPDTATSLNDLAALYQAQGRFGEAEPLFKRALAIREKALGPDHNETATSLNSLASLYLHQGRYGEAEPLYKRALAIREKVLGPEHPDTANSLNNLAALYAAQGRYGEAEPLYKRALAIREKVLGPEHPDTASTLTNLVFFSLRVDKASAASPLVSRLTRSQADWLRRELPLQPRELRPSLLAEQPDAVATTFALLDQDAGSAPLALETRLNRQGLLAEIEQRQRLLLASSPQTRQLGERLAGLDRQLASVTLTPTQREELRSQRQQLEGELNRLLPALQIKPVSTTQVAAALQALAPQGLLVEFQRYSPLSRQGSGPAAWGEARYVALVLHPDGRIAAIPLGPAAPIDQAIGRALNATVAKPSEAAGFWAQVSAQVLDPLKPQLLGVRELFLSPDAGLHRVPFAALPAPGNEGRLLNEAFQLRLLTTGRDLLRLQQPPRGGTAPTLIANPDYDAIRRTTRSAGPAPAAGNVRATPSERQQRSGELTATTRWTPLRGTAQEAPVLAPMLGVSHPITEGAATASLVMREQAPRILHIATHGFFLKAQPTPPSNPLTPPRSAGSLRAERLEDPLLRSGLVMAGANHPDANPSDDGYLTAAEVTGINLDGTELVTLSACQSGLGDLQSGEGVYGLQRALTVAGARSTLLSLWNVDDVATRAFMQAFYTRLMRGEPRAEALARTQADFRHHPKPLYRDPYVWAAFQLTGDWRSIGPAGKP